MTPRPSPRAGRPGAILALLAATLVVATPARSQSFESLLDDVTDLNVFLSCWQTPDNLDDPGSCLGDRSGFGLEVLLALGGSDSTRAALYELGLGYSQFGGFGSADPRYELSGTVRDLPAVSLYATWLLSEYVNPYAGLRTGLVTLQDVQAFVRYEAPDEGAGAVYHAEAQAFQLGPVGGVALGAGRVFLNAEAAYLLRRFPSVRWSGPEGLPAAIPRQLDFSGLSFSLGVQVRIDES